MSLRSTLIGLFVIVALSAGGLFAVKSIFTRDAQMRDAERSFYESNRAEYAAAAANRSGEDETETVWADDGADGGFEDDAPVSLDDWYAAAGSSNEPASADPEDKSFLINDAEPYSDAEPIDIDAEEL